MSTSLPFKRILLKISGEALQGDRGYGISPQILLSLGDEIRQVASQGIQVAIVIGGGNIFRGVAGSAHGMDRAHADYMGMLGTVINALALQDGLEKIGVSTRVQTAIAMSSVAEPYIRLRAMRHLEKGRVVIFAAGTGNPYFTTDTAAALRAMEIGADVLLKATHVDGVYDADPKTHPNAVRFTTLSYMDVLQRDLRVMDTAAISLCKDNSMPLMVFDMGKAGNICKASLGDPIGTYIGSEAQIRAFQARYTEVT